MGHPIADCQLSIVDWLTQVRANWQLEIGNRQSAIGNLMTHPLTQVVLTFSYGAGRILS